MQNNKRQTTLSGKKTSENHRLKDNAGAQKPIEDVARYDPEQEKRISKFVRSCIKKKQNYAYLRVWTAIKNTLTEKNEKFIFEAVVERPFRETWDSYGGHWGNNNTVDRHDVEGAKETIMEFFRAEMANPYVTPKEKKDLKEYWFRDIHDDRIKVFYSRQAYIWLGNEACKEINEEVEKLKGNVATEKQKQLAKREGDIKVIISDINTEIRKYEEKINSMQGKNMEYDDIEPYMKQVYIGKQKIGKLNIEHRKICDMLREIKWGENCEN